MGWGLEPPPWHYQMLPCRRGDREEHSGRAERVCRRQEVKVRLVGHFFVPFMGKIERKFKMEAMFDKLKRQRKRQNGARNQPLQGVSTKGH